MVRRKCFSSVYKRAALTLAEVCTPRTPVEMTVLRTLHISLPLQLSSYVLRLRGCAVLMVADARVRGSS